MIPSFKRELDRLYSIRWLAQQQGKEHTSWQSKLAFKWLAESCGIKTAETYQVADSVSELKKPTQPRFVVKPARGSANRGVYPVITKNGKLYAHFADKFMNWNEIKKALAKADNVKPPYIIEEYIGDKPDNWELYCFDGEVGLIRQRRQVWGRNVEGRTHKFWSVDWEDAGELDERVYDHDLPKPLHPDELLQVAKKLSKVLPFVFARIDLYDTPEGVYYGEVTHHPGVMAKYPDEIDKKLGRMWLEGEARRL